MDKCPRCGSTLEYDEVDVGVGTVRGNVGCPECLWTPDIVDDLSHCPHSLTGKHSWELNDGTQCAHCLKFSTRIEPQFDDGVDYGKPH